MPPPDLSEVGHGLAVVHWGFRLVAGVVVTAFALVVLTALFNLSINSLEFGYLDLMVGVLGLCALGVAFLLGMVGRERCLDTPSELPVARVRVRLAVALEGCGWVSGVVNSGVTAVDLLGLASVPHELLYAVFGFALLLFLAGRAFFLAYLGSLARSFGVPLLSPLPTGTLMILVTSSAIVGTCVGILFANGSPPTGGQLGLAAVCFAVVLGVLCAMDNYGRLLRRVREATTQFNTRPMEPDSL